MMVVQDELTPYRHFGSFCIGPVCVDDDAGTSSIFQFVVMLSVHNRLSLLSVQLDTNSESSDSTYWPSRNVSPVR